MNFNSTFNAFARKILYIVNKYGFFWEELYENFIICLSILDINYRIKNMEKTAIIALGGNALSNKQQAGTVKEQFGNTKKSLTFFANVWQTTHVSLYPAYSTSNKLYWLSNSDTSKYKCQLL